jgi:hypothetical protein
MSFGQLQFTDVNCDMARMKCGNQGLDFVSCMPVPGAIDPMNMVRAVCREKTQAEQLAWVGAAMGLGAVASGLVFYYQDKDPLKGAALGGVLGLVFYAWG